MPKCGKCGADSVPLAEVPTSSGHRENWCAECIDARTWDEHGAAVLIVALLGVAVVAGLLAVLALVRAVGS